jgi:ABC-2 type transport system ATP-binding protein
MNWVVEASNVSKKYGTKAAIDNLTVSFPEGQITGLLGHNGAGKSTLFKMIVGLTRAQSGVIKVFGNEPSWKNNDKIAYLPDRARWYGYQTVEQAFVYANSIFPFFNMERAQEMAQFMSLDPDQKISSMSKGQEARLLLILCLARDVQLVLLDEPFSGIDLISREKIVNGIIDSMINRQQTIIISTHEIHEAESLFDHVVLLDQGRVVMAEDAEKLRAEKGSIESVYRSVFR